jgi:hypothetical protein
MRSIIGTVPAEIFSYHPSRAIKFAPGTRGATASSGSMRVGDSQKIMHSPEPIKAVRFPRLDIIVAL